MVITVWVRRQITRRMRRITLGSQEGTLNPRGCGFPSSFVRVDVLTVTPASVLRDASSLSQCQPLTWGLKTGSRHPNAPPEPYTRARRARRNVSEHLMITGPGGRDKQRFHSGTPDSLRGASVSPSLMNILAHPPWAPCSFPCSFYLNPPNGPAHYFCA